MINLVTQLRNLSNQPYTVGAPTCDTLKKAADKIEQYQRALTNIQYILADESEMTEIMLCTLRDYVDRKVKEFDDA